jgi:hypothetical protein
MLDTNRCSALWTSCQFHGHTTFSNGELLITSQYSPDGMSIELFERTGCPFMR